MIDRRTMITAALAVIATPISTRTALAQAAMSRVTAYAFSFPALAGGDIRLAEYAGRPLLVVNTASLCGFTPQYAGLQELWTEFRGRGLMIIGVPSNDFGAQEPGGPTEIAEDRAAPLWSSPFGRYRCTENTGSFGEMAGRRLNADLMRY
jgi:glutathione peroxidase